MYCKICKTKINNTIYMAYDNSFCSIDHRKNFIDNYIIDNDNNNIIDDNDEDILKIITKQPLKNDFMIQKNNNTVDSSNSYCMSICIFFLI